MLEDRLKSDIFTEIPNGLPGIETRFPLIYTGGVNFGRFGLKTLVRLLSTYPALISGLYPQKGTIKPGSDADFAVFDMNAHTSLSVKDLHGRADHSPYEDMITPGKIFMVIKGGEIAYVEGEFLETQPGKFLKRQKINDLIISKLMKDRTND
jgi:dihydropyrimidinase